MKRELRLSPEAERQLRAERDAVRAPEGIIGAIGLEAEFNVLLDGKQVKPEDVFESPTNIVRDPMIHRSGKSYHLPTGGAVYFDTGVIEIATGMFELEQGCAARAGRALWENISYLRGELDDWEQRDGRHVELSGFSAHYNVSFRPTGPRRPDRTVKKLALLLTYILPIPVMLFAANRKSTGIGVRPRGTRVEVTADFTPNPSLMIAAATICVGIIEAVMRWPTYALSALDDLRGELPMIRDVHPVPASTRKGWSAKYSCYPENPFTQDLDEPMWKTTGGETLSLRMIATRILNYFRDDIVHYADPRTLKLIDNVIAGRRLSLLELKDRPPEYDSVGRLCHWDGHFDERTLSRSRYERVLTRAISGEQLELGRDTYVPVGMRGWSHVVFQRAADKSRHVLSFDFLLAHLDDWESGAR